MVGAERPPPRLDPGVPVLLLDCALWLVIAGAVVALRGLLLPGCHREHVWSGCATLGLAGVAGALALALLPASAD